MEEEKQSKVTDDMKNRPRMLSLDSGNYSEVSKRNDSQKSDGVKPPCHITFSSISTVSMGDISSWYNNGEYYAEIKLIIPIVFRFSDYYLHQNIEAQLYFGSWYKKNLS